jgi:lipopolysaccharide transport system ATP-binding protein
MDDTVIRISNLSKRYRIGAREGYKTFRETLVDAAKAPFVRLSGAFSKGLRAKRESPNSSLSTPGSKHSSRSDDLIWALRDVSFEVKQGEVVGIIGRNGAGKSTLLKILCKITEPTEGRVELRGRVGSLLEVGTGFHPELTGHENVYLYGAILGMDRWEVTRKFDEIVSFAEIEKFIDTPVKKYSSGMYMRLAFAVAAHLEPEILLVDEVLAVGDAAFQKKCLGKMGDVSKAGRTVLFVSHNMGAINRLCRRSLWLDDGRVLKEGDTAEIIHRYQSQSFVAAPHWQRVDHSNASGDLAFISVKATNDQYQMTSHFAGDEMIRVLIEYRVGRYLSGCQIGVRLHNSEGLPILTTADSDATGASATSKEPGLYHASFKIPGNLLVPGTYSLLIAAHLPQRNVYELIEQAIVFEVLPPGSLTSLDGRYGLIAPLFNWETHREEIA